MRILISTYTFAPEIGGLETACLTLAEGFVDRGYDVTVVTMTPAAEGEEDRYPFPVIRGPNLFQQARLVHNYDVLWVNGISLRLAGLLTSRIPKVFVHHAPLQYPHLKRLLCLMGTNIHVSRAMQEMVNLPGIIIPNSYDEDTFRLIPEVPRDLDFAYVGRLAPEKGIDDFIDALARLGSRRFTATIIGEGPEEGSLKAQVEAAGLADRVTFAGVVRGEPLAHLLNRHKVIAMPSRWEEPFGIVALEGAACGCVVVGTRSGGLVEAIGPCGPILAKNDPAALAAALARLTDDPSYLAGFRDKAAAHLQRFTRKQLIDASEQLLWDAARPPTTRRAEPTTGSAPPRVSRLGN
jgi:glycosyltransferase involved in cell wall biosynthesis